MIPVFGATRFRHVPLGGRYRVIRRWRSPAKAILVVADGIGRLTRPAIAAAALCVARSRPVTLYGRISMLRGLLTGLVPTSSDGQWMRSPLGRGRHREHSTRPSPIFPNSDHQDENPLQ
jgi:hypothetical protein